MLKPDNLYINVYFNSTHELKLDEVYYECKDCSRMLDLYKAYDEKITDNINAITICE